MYLRTLVKAVHLGGQDRSGHAHDTVHVEQKSTETTFCMLFEAACVEKLDGQVVHFAGAPEEVKKISPQENSPDGDRQHQATLVGFYTSCLTRNDN